MIKRKNITLYIPIIFICIASLIGTSPSNSNNLEIIRKTYILPKLISNGAYVTYYSMILLLLLTGILKVMKGFKISKEYVPLITAYLILTIWSFTTNTDHLRYLTILLCIIFCPVGLLFYINKIDFNKLSSSLIFISFILLISTILYSFLNFSTHPRISGFHSNPNLMGMWLVSLYTLILYFSSEIKKITIITFSVAIFILVIFTGSRLSLGMFTLILLPFIWKYKKLTLITIIFILIILYFLSGNIDLNFRALDINNSISDSGRNIIWERAFKCIFSEPLVGHGMLAAEECIKTDNVHNSYLRIASMLGIPLTIIFFSLYFYFILTSFFSPINPFIKFYFLSLTLAFFAEDYIVGISSPFFPFLIIILTLFLYEFKKSKYKLEH